MEFNVIHIFSKLFIYSISCSMWWNLRTHLRDFRIQHLPLKPQSRKSSEHGRFWVNRHTQGSPICKMQTSNLIYMQSMMNLCMRQCIFDISHFRLTRLHTEGIRWPFGPLCFKYTNNLGSTIYNMQHECIQEMMLHVLIATVKLN